jgi:aspartate/methionine/tyrosine aminotransferase
LAWEEPWVSQGVPSLLDPRVNGGDLTSLLALYSLSKRSSAAGYRMAWIAGDPKIIKPLLEIRKHMGMMVPGPVQAAMVAAVADESHVAEQVERYSQRRTKLLAALAEAGYVVDNSQAGLYLWLRAQDGADAWTMIERLANVGILAAPGTFYGDQSHVRLSLTATDAAIEDAVLRLTE